MPSPNDDWGYDVADYTAVHPELGTLEDLDALVAGARERGIRVLLDLVPNHTSDQHPWFVDALSGRDARHRDYYVWADPAPGRRAAEQLGVELRRLRVDSSTSRPASTTCNNFLPSQPDLNWWNDEVRDAFDDILRFWYDRGIAGFRIDVCHAIVKDRELRDDPAVTPDDHPEVRKRALQAGVLDEPARGPRRAAPLARRVATRTTRAGSSSGRRTCSTSTRWCRSTATARTS